MSKVCEFAVNVVAFLYLNVLLEIVAGNGAIGWIIFLDDPIYLVWCRPGWTTTVTYLTSAPAPPLVFLYQQLHTTIS